MRVAGRITALRSFGKAAFVRLSEGQGTLQLHLRRDVLPERDFRLTKQLDLGDWVGVAGPMFRTRTDELTVRADSFSFLAKGPSPPPGEVARARRPRHPLPAALSRPAGKPRNPRGVSQGGRRWSPRCGASWTAKDSSKSRRPCCSRSRRGRRRGRSRRDTRRSVWNSSSGWPPSCTSSGWWSAVFPRFTRSIATSGTKGSRRGTTRSSRCSSSTGRSATAPT